MTSLRSKGTQLYVACCQAFQEYCDQDTLVGCLDEFEGYLAALEAWLKHVRKCTLQMLQAAADFIKTVATRCCDVIAAL